MSIFQLSDFLKNGGELRIIAFYCSLYCSPDAILFTASFALESLICI